MSRLPFEIMLALRYLRPKRTFVSVITLISIIGVMLGVAVLIIVLSVMSGFSNQLRDRILGFNAHLRVYSSAPMRDYGEVMDLIKAHPQVKGVAPYVMLKALVKTQPPYGEPLADAPLIRGLDPRLEHTVTTLPDSIVQGEFDLRGNGILIGQELARRMRLTLGDRLEIYSVPALQRMKEAYEQGEGAQVELASEYDVRGIFDAGFFEYNDLFILTSLANAQDLLGLDEAVEGLIIMAHDPWKVDQIRKELEPKLLQHAPWLYMSTWSEENHQIMEALLVEKNVMFYTLFFIMIVAAFGITNSLITFVIQKTREIGVLKALGASNRQVRWLFLSQSLIVGVCGVLAGLALGLLALSYRNEFLLAMRQLTNRELFPARIYGFTELPALIVPGDILLICGGSLLICIFAGLIPAWIAGRLRPVQALRYE